MSRSLPASLLVLALSLGSQARAESPNIILFLVDDLGWMDTAVYGSRYYETPNIDRLAAAGMLFSDAYAASPHCSPTRASILTGKYPARLGITVASGALPPLPLDSSRFPTAAPESIQWLSPESRRFLPAEEVTLAEALRERGYRTAHIGKWHLGREPRHWPDKQGFDVAFHAAPDPGPPSYFSPYGFRRGTITDGPEGEYITDRLTDEALEFIQANRERPFFLHLSHFGVHGPWGFKEELRRKFAGRRDPRGGQGNSVMAAMIDSVDQSLGRIVDKLAELALTDRTMIVFLSDNGGAMHTRIGPDDLLPTDNSPLRGAKGLLYEGGVRVPLIVSWPSLIESGSHSAEVVSSIDLYPTILDAAGLEPRADQILDGESLMPLLKQSGGLRSRALFNYFALYGRRVPPGATVRSGSWKLIRWFQKTPWFPDELELYDLGADVGETTNLAGQMPSLARRLNGLIDDFLDETRVLLPIANPAFDPQAAARGGWKADRYLTLWPTVVEHRLEVEVRNGTLRCSLAERRDGWSGLEFFFLGHRAERREVGPYLLELQARSTSDLQGRVLLRYPDSPWEMERAQSFGLAGGPSWQEVPLRLTVEQAPVSIRLDFRTGAGDVEIDQIRLVALDGSGSWPAFAPRLEWRFDPPVDSL